MICLPLVVLAPMLFQLARLSASRRSQRGEIRAPHPIERGLFSRLLTRECAFCFTPRHLVLLERLFIVVSETIEPAPRLARKKERSGPSLRGDQLIDRGAIITGE